MSHRWYMYSLWTLQVQWKSFCQTCIMSLCGLYTIPLGKRKNEMIVLWTFIVLSAPEVLKRSQNSSNLNASSGLSSRIMSYVEPSVTSLTGKNLIDRTFSYVMCIPKTYILVPITSKITKWVLGKGENRNEYMRWSELPEETNEEANFVFCSWNAIRFKGGTCEHKARYKQEQLITVRKKYWK